MGRQTDNGANRNAPPPPKYHHRIKCINTGFAILHFLINNWGHSGQGVGRVMQRWCWVNFQFRGVLLIWIKVGQGPTALGVGAGGGCLDILTLLCPFSPLSPSLWETV